jgi:hypothetical protein
MKKDITFTSRQAAHGTLMLWCPLHDCCHDKSRAEEIALKVDKGKLDDTDLTEHQRC